MPEQGLNITNYIESTKYTSSDSPSLSSLLDLIVRIKETEHETFEVSWHKTKDHFAPFVNLYFETAILRHALKNQWRSYKYNQEYIQFLLGGYTEEEFLEVAKGYALPFTHIDKDQLGIGASVILNVLGGAVTSGDLSFLLNVDPVDVDAALESYPFANKYQEIEGEEGGKTE